MATLNTVVYNPAHFCTLIALFLLLQNFNGISDNSDFTIRCYAGNIEVRSKFFSSNVATLKSSKKTNMTKVILFTYRVKKLI